MPPGRRIVVIAQQQHPVRGVEHDDPARAPQRQPGHLLHPAVRQARGLASVHACHCAGHPRAGTRAASPPHRHGGADSTAPSRSRGHRECRWTARTGVAGRGVPAARFDIGDWADNWDSGSRTSWRACHARASCSPACWSCPRTIFCCACSAGRRPRSAPPVNGRASPSSASSRAQSSAGRPTTRTASEAAWRTAAEPASGRPAAI